MADYNCFSRTNYFKVTDVEKLKQLVELIPEAELWEEAYGSFGFGAHGSITQAFLKDDRTDEYEEFEVAEEIQKILPEGEICIIQEVGYEKLRYLIGYSILITKDIIKIVDLSQVTKSLAAELIGDEKASLIELSY